MSDDKKPKKPKRPYPKPRAYDWTDLDHDPDWIAENPEWQ